MNQRKLIVSLVGNMPQKKMHFLMSCSGQYDHFNTFCQTSIVGFDDKGLRKARRDSR